MTISKYLFIYSHLNQYKISVKLSYYDTQIVAFIKEIKVEDLNILQTKLEQFKKWNLVDTLDTVR